MTGVTWDHRKPGDWLASNGRWYPQSQHPRGWDRLALPPAPDHGSVAQMHGRIADRANSAASRTQSQDPSARRSGRPTSPPSGPPGESASVPEPQRGRRRTAAATASNVRTYKYRLDRGEEPPVALPPADEWRDLPAPPILPGEQPARSTPPPPGRLSAPGDENDPPVPVQRPPEQPTPPNHNPLSGVSIMGNDLGGLLDRAKQRIEDAIEESADEGKWS